MPGVTIEGDCRYSRRVRISWKREVRRQDWSMAKRHVDCFNEHDDILPMLRVFVSS